VSLEELQRGAAEARSGALRLVEGVGIGDLDKPQRVLRRQILHQLETAGMTQGDWFREKNHVLAVYDSTRRALYLIAKLERSGLTTQQKSAVSAATSALHAAEDAASEASRLV
jgi:hypothetical protein